MKYLSILSLTALVLFSCQPSQQTQEDKILSQAEQILEKTINFHDPENNWATFASSVEMQSYIPSRSEDKRVMIVVLDNEKSAFTSQYLQDGYAFTREVKGEEECQSSWAKPDLTAEDSSRYRLNCAAAERSRDYYRYLLGLPMVLTDSAAHLSDSIYTQVVDGVSCDVLTVDYYPMGEHPTWEFYVNQENGALIQTRFFTYHADRDTTTGEIIKLRELVDFDGMKKFGEFEWQYLDSSLLASETFLFEPI